MAATIRRSEVRVTETGAENIAGITCPDSKRRTFRVQGTLPNGNKRGFVQVCGISVAGIAKRSGKAGKGWKFYPNADGKNIHLIRPTHFPAGTKVVMNETKANGVIVVVDWNYMTPIYHVRPTGLGKGKRKPIVISGSDNLTVVE